MFNPTIIKHFFIFSSFWFLVFCGGTSIIFNSIQTLSSRVTEKKNRTCFKCCEKYRCRCKLNHSITQHTYTYTNGDRTHNHARGNTLTHPHTRSFTHTYKGALTGLALKTHFEISQMRNVLFFGNEIHNLTFFSSPTNQKLRF